MSERALVESTARPQQKRGALSKLSSQLAKFAIVGGVGFVVDLAVFNILLLQAQNLVGWPIIAKVVSTGIAIAVNWIGNHWWTFREHRQRNTLREGIEFLIASLIGSAVSLACLAISHYVLHFTSVLSDNISANVIGLALGSAVRFAAYRWWVFAERE